MHRVKGRQAHHDPPQQAGDPTPQAGTVNLELGGDRQPQGPEGTRRNDQPFDRPKRSEPERVHGHGADDECDQHPGGRSMTFRHGVILAGPAEAMAHAGRLVR